MAIEIVDFPIKNSDFPVSYVKLPEGILGNHLKDVQGAEIPVGDRRADIPEVL